MAKDKKYRTVERSLGDIQAQFVYVPEAPAASLQDYLEHELAEGWALVGMVGSVFVFKAVK